MESVKIDLDNLVVCLQDRGANTGGLEMIMAEIREERKNAFATTNSEGISNI